MKKIKKFKLIQHNSLSQLRFSNFDDTEEYLELNKIYVGEEEVHDWHTKIIIGEHKFNSVCFEEIKDGN